MEPTRCDGAGSTTPEGEEGRLRLLHCHVKVFSRFFGFFLYPAPNLRFRSLRYLFSFVSFHLLFSVTNGWVVFVVWWSDFFPLYLPFKYLIVYFLSFIQFPQSCASTPCQGQLSEEERQLLRQPSRFHDAYLPSHLRYPYSTVQISILSIFAFSV